MMALTATANDQVFKDVRRTLGLRPDTFELRKSFNRDNLRYEVLPKTSKAKTAKEMAAKCLQQPCVLSFRARARTRLAAPPSHQTTAPSNHAHCAHPSLHPPVYAYTHTRARRSECGIIYCFSKRDCEDITELLLKAFVGTPLANRVDFYHAGLEAHERERRQASWMRDDLRCVSVHVQLSVCLCVCLSVCSRLSRLSLFWTGLKQRVRLTTAL